ncbi:MAG TPA: MFS transporter [Candidatus Dormibacteraeota bacterium]|nr:MFS transporter [Candidatus Dormibacteraeota bacterium]
MLGPYRTLFDAPGAASFCLAGFLARITMSTVGLGIVLVVSGLRGGYTLAGSVAAAYALTGALAASRAARLADRHGQARVLPFSTALLAVGVLALVGCAAWGAPAWTLFLAAIVAGGGNASVGALVRARWTRLYRGSPLLHTAYSLEAVIDELVFIAGPIVVTVLVTRVDAVAGLLVVLAIAVAGLLWLAALRATQPEPGRNDGRVRSVLRLPTIAVLVAVMVALGTALASTEVITVGFVSQAGHRELAGAVLACWALGSALAGLGYGALPVRGSLRRRFLACVTAAWLISFLLLLPTSVAGLTLALFICGLSIAPTLITQVGLVEAAVPPGALTEGIAWTTTALALGAAAGNAAGGLAVDRLGPHLAFSVPVLAGAAALAATVAGARWLAPGPRPFRPADEVIGPG